MLTLPIKKKWYDMIVQGKKTDEYREITHYYTCRFRSFFTLQLWPDETVEKAVRASSSSGGLPFSNVVLRNGYGRKCRATMISGSLLIGQGRPEWGAEKGREYYILRIERMEPLLTTGEDYPARITRIEEEKDG